jgi:hypothetical protein
MMGGLSGYFAGGMAKGITSGLKNINDIRAADETSKRTGILQQEQDTRNAEEVRKAETYADDLTPIPIEVGKQAFKDPDHAEYAVGQARSMGIVRKNPQTGEEYVYKKDARALATYLKDPNVIKQSADYRLDATKSRLDAAEAALKGNETDNAKILAVQKAKSDYQLARSQHPELATIDRDASKPFVVPPGARVIQNGKEVIPAVKPEPKTVDEKALRDIEETGTVSPGLRELYKIKKERPEGSGVAEEIRLERLEKMRRDKEKEGKDQNYRRQERLDKAFDTDEDKLKKQYEKDVIDIGKPKADEKWNNEVRALQKKYIPKYKNIGVDFYSGESIEPDDGISIPEGMRDRGPAKQPAQIERSLPVSKGEKPIRQPLGGSPGLAGTAKSSGGAGPAPNTTKPAGKKIKVRYERDGEGNTWMILPDGTEKRVKEITEDGKVIF